MFYEAESKTVVFKLNTFQPNGLTELQPGQPLSSSTAWRDFAKTMSSTLEIAKKEGTDRLLIDVIGNGGGLVDLSYLMMAFFEPSWISNDTRELSEDYDFRISPAMYEIVDNLAKTRASVPDEPTAEEVANYLKVFSQNPVTDDLQNMTAAERREFIHKTIDQFESFLTRLAFFGLVDRADGNIMSLSYLIQHQVPRRRGGRLGNYTRKGAYQFTTTAQDFNKSFGFPQERVFNHIVLLTDGTCGSACSLFSTKMMLSRRAVAVSYGGLLGQAMDTSSFAGGNVVVRTGSTKSQLNKYCIAGNFRQKFNFVAFVKATFWLN